LLLCRSFDVEHVFGWQQPGEVRGFSCVKQLLREYLLVKRLGNDFGQIHTRPFKRGGGVGDLQGGGLLPVSENAAVKADRLPFPTGDFGPQEGLQGRPEALFQGVGFPVFGTGHHLGVLPNTGGSGAAISNCGTVARKLSRKANKCSPAGVGHIRPSGTVMAQRCLSAMSLVPMAVPARDYSRRHRERLWQGKPV